MNLQIKYKVDGSVAKYKAHLVARGFSQIPGVDYGETYSPIVKITSIRVLLALATQLHLEVHQFDIKTVFLHGLLDAEIYMELPEGLKERGHIGLVCRLLKALYGLHQSSHVWYYRLDTYLVAHGFICTTVDSNIYIKTYNNSIFITVAVYVDDCIVVSQHLHLIYELKSTTEKEFEMTYEGDINFCLGIQIIRNRIEGWMMLLQEKYLRVILQRFNMENCHAIATPMEAGSTLSQTNLSQLEDFNVGGPDATPDISTRNPCTICMILHIQLSIYKSCPRSICSCCQMKNYCCYNPELGATLVLQHLMMATSETAGRP